MSDKLHIPGPDQQEDLTELNLSIVLGWAVCMLICIALFLFFRERRPEPVSAEPEDPVAVHQERLLSQARAEQRSFDNMAWERDDAVAIMRLGPREPAEAACRKLRPKLTSGELDRRVHVEMLKSVDKREPHAPWTCLLRAHLADAISAKYGLRKEMGEFWAQMRNFEAAPQIVASVLEDFRQTRERPEADAFYRWLRLCGVHPDYAAAPACQKLLYQLSPAQGEDILMSVETHLQKMQPSDHFRDMQRLVPAVGRLARQGQPEAWRRERVADPARYDTQMRLGATFLLCRFVNSPKQHVARPAAEELAETAGMAARAVDKNLVRRWREACTRAFAAGEDAQAVAVWSGNPKVAPRYQIDAAIERGLCSPAGELPAWSCALQLWNGDPQKPIESELMGFFNETRHVEWR